MRILWITNQATAIVGQSIGLNSMVDGGWLEDMSMQLSKSHDLGIAFPINIKSEYKKGRTSDISYYAIPMNRTGVKPNYSLVQVYKEIILEFDPDIIHIWGTELVHSYLAIKAAELCKKDDKVVVSIQGLVSVISKHYMGHIDTKKLCPVTLKDIYRGTGILRQKKYFEIRGKYEQETLKIAKHVIGRTEWDYACSKQINPQINYHFCHETLRKSFYSSEWSIANCQPHSIFVSQSQYPIKGFHLVLEAARYLKIMYPNFHIYVTGRDRLNTNWKFRLKDTQYDEYLRRLIRKYGLDKHITFTGFLEENQMKEHFLKANVFVLPSTIENSPNAMGEAMILGVPVVASDVGGVRDLLEHGKDGFIYPSDEPYMMAHYISKIFDDSELASTMSRNSKQHAVKTHNSEINYLRLIEIYEEIK